MIRVSSTVTGRIPSIRHITSARAQLYRRRHYCDRNCVWRRIRAWPLGRGRTVLGRRGQLGREQSQSSIGHRRRQQHRQQMAAPRRTSPRSRQSRRWPATAELPRQRRSAGDQAGRRRQPQQRRSNSRPANRPAAGAGHRPNCRNASVGRRSAQSRRATSRAAEGRTPALPIAVVVVVECTRCHRGGGGGAAMHARGGGGGGMRGGGGGGMRGGGGGGRGGGGRRSDIMLKHDITLLGHLDNGLGFYRFSYNGSDKTYVGVMAQEVQQVMPEAVARDRDGYLQCVLRPARSDVRELRALDQIGSASSSRGALAALSGNGPRDDVRSTSADRLDPLSAVVLHIGFNNIRRKRECARAARARPSWRRRQSKTRSAETSTKSSRLLAQRDQPD